MTKRHLVALGSTVLTALSLLIAPAVASVPHPSAQAQARGLFTGYALVRPICQAPVRPGQFTCMAYRRVDVPAGTPGAHRYTMPQWARGPVGGYTPAALASAYRYDPKQPTTKTVAIVDWDGAPHVRQDLNTFDRHYGLPQETATSLRVVNGKGAAAPLPKGTPDGSVEISLDVQAVRGVCNKCKILLVEAATGDAAHLAGAENTAVRLGANVVSNSFGAPEDAAHPFPKSVYSAFNHKGVVIAAASGDNGWDFWDDANNDPSGYALYAPESASFPASMSTVVSVGGTRLLLNANGARSSETVWNDNGSNDAGGINYGGSMGATGGGCSRQFSPPGWQSTLLAYRQSGCHKRLSVDVAALGDPLTGFDIIDSYAIGGWVTIGGTSLSAPLIAGMWALAGAGQGMAYPGRALYQNYRFRPGSLHDVTVGGSGWCAGTATSDCATAAQNYDGINNPNAIYGTKVDCSFPLSGKVTSFPARNPECNAVRGYDGPSGVGAPGNLRAFRTTSPSVRMTAYVHTVNAATRTWMYATKVLPTTRIVRYGWRWGDGTGSATTSYTTTHVYHHAGTYTILGSVTDNLGQVSYTTHRILVR